MLTIGVIGPEFLIQKNREILEPKGCKVMALSHSSQLQQMDGMIITGWQAQHYRQQVNRWCRELNQLEQQNMAILAIAHGVVAMGQNGRLKLMDYCTTSRPVGLFTAPLEIPSMDGVRFLAHFLSEIHFQSLAPNLGVLCQDRAHGPVVVRQGDYLACSYVAELTKQTYLYDYWLEMVFSTKIT